MTELATTTPTRRAPPLRFRTLLYRYWFFAWLFRDVGRGSLFERAAAWRHNQEQARWLPTYMRRWLVTGLVAFAAGAAIEQLGGAALLASVFFVPSAIAVPINAMIGAAWLGLKLLPAPG
ncbi:hypothetical protein OOT46_01780 [Aquabacterium sp. A7-Y]|uniref:hypothetical protein n=1 Tax=Aquabacterium sp. A7-Y TaxID=1349605 RepID=UPI00223CCA26|nr:hypothetical protein [Aquabacterium sp. A7-Y]MCW7536585.1 hypothetical protein [Aquabacterium sp. A7-Y]